MVIAAEEKALKAERGELNYLYFKVGDYSFALNIDSLVRVLDLSTVGYREEGEKQLDLRKILVSEGQADSKSGGGGFQIDLKMQIGEYSILVDSVLGIRNFQLAVPLDFPGALRNEKNQAIRGLFFDGEKMICELDAEKLVDYFLKNGA